MIRKIVLALVSIALLSAPLSAEAGPLRNGARAVGRGVVKVLKRVVHPLKRGC